MVDYTLTRSSRKTCAIVIRGGVIEVKAPLKMAKRDIDKLVASKQSWIEKHLTQSLEKAEQKADFSLAYGDKILYRGATYPIITKPGNRVGFADGTFYIPPDLDSERIKYACVQIYKMLAKRDLTAKVAEFSKRMSVTPIAVKVNSAKTRWGSCSGKKSLNFSWRLMMAEDAVIDYVVVHELAHITEMNHSARFWAIVEGVLPDYKQRQQRLKALQKRLSTEDWE